MLNRISNIADGWRALEVFAVLVPVIIFLWVILTVIALHKRDAYFWSLSSTWSSIISCPLALLIMSLGGWSQLHEPNVPPFHAPIVAGAILYAVAIAFAIFYNYNITRSVILAVSTAMMQQLAVLGVIFLFVRWTGNEANRDRYGQ
jgi:hypothetical protein